MLHALISRGRPGPPRLGKLPLTSTTRLLSRLMFLVVYAASGACAPSKPANKASNTSFSICRFVAVSASQFYSVGFKGQVVKFCIYFWAPSVSTEAWETFSRKARMP